MKVLIKLKEIVFFYTPIGNTTWTWTGHQRKRRHEVGRACGGVWGELKGKMEGKYISFIV